MHFLRLRLLYSRLCYVTLGAPLSKRVSSEPQIPLGIPFSLLGYSLCLSQHEAWLCMMVQPRCSLEAQGTHQRPSSHPGPLHPEDSERTYCHWGLGASSGHPPTEGHQKKFGKLDPGFCSVKLYFPTPPGLRGTAGDHGPFCRTRLPALWTWAGCLRRSSSLEKKNCRNLDN